MMLRMNTEGSDYGSWEAGSYFHDDEDDDFHDDTDVDDDEDDEEEVGEEEYDGADLENDADAFDVHAHNDDVEGNNTNVELDPAGFSSDEAYARALQDAEDREMAARLFALAGINDRKYLGTSLLFIVLILKMVWVWYFCVLDEAEDSDDHGGNSQVIIALAFNRVFPPLLSYCSL